MSKTKIIIIILGMLILILTGIIGKSFYDKSKEKQLENLKIINLTTFQKGISAGQDLTFNFIFESIDKKGVVRIKRDLDEKVYNLVENGSCK